MDEKTDPGFYEGPVTELSQITSDALSMIYQRAGIEEGDPKLKAVVIVTVDDDDDEGFEHVGGSFGGFDGSVDMVMWMLHETMNMAEKAGIPMQLGIPVPMGPSQN